MIKALPHATWIPFALTALFVGCDPGPPPRPVGADSSTISQSWGQQDGGAPPVHDDLGPSPWQDLGAVATDGGGPAATSCPKVDGRWEGTLQGKLTGFFNMNVTGTLWMELKAGATPGDYKITGGEMASWAVGLKALTFKQPVEGSVACGVLTGSGDANIFGTQSKGTTKCTFDAAGTVCKGVWTGQSTDGKSGGSGTFEVKRKTSP